MKDVLLLQVRQGGQSMMVGGGFKDWAWSLKFMLVLLRSR